MIDRQSNGLFTVRVDILTSRKVNNFLRFVCERARTLTILLARPLILILLSSAPTNVRSVACSRLHLKLFTYVVLMHKVRNSTVEPQLS